ncbi:MAG: anionic cell wall polymer biosynthesis LytR-Cps2A-Psr (LCP) family protein, partial [Glaciecola sp.]
MSRASKPSLRFASTTARRVGITLLVLVQVTLLSISGLYASARWIALPVGGNDPYVLLVLGSDQGPPRTGTALGGRADGFHLLVVAPDRAHVSILSFPRDTWVSIPGVGNRKINKALTYGADKAVATAESVT